jgi:hypothetical protein
MRPVLSAVVLAGALLIPVGAPAQVYRWVDDRGTVHYAEGADSVPERFRPMAELVLSRTASPPPEPRKDAPPTAPAATIPFTPGAPIVLSAKINGGGPVMLMLDTGADRTVVAPLALWRIGISTWFAPRAEIRGATGSARADAVRVDSVEVGDAKAGPMVVIAHDMELGNVDGVLGRDFLDQFRVNIDTAAGVVTLAPR